MDDGISAWLARTRIALGSRKGTAAASLIVEAFGDAVVPQIPEAIGRAILRTESALNAVLGGGTLDSGIAAVEASICAHSGDAGADGNAPDVRGSAASADRTDNAPTDDPADRGGAA
ncbi:hypothetical protein O4J55_00440 [Paracoccus sp. PXZ]